MVYLHIALLLLLLFPNCNLYRTRGNPFSAVDCWARLLKDGANNQTTNKRSAILLLLLLCGCLYIYARDRELPGRRIYRSRGQERKTETLG